MKQTRDIGGYGGLGNRRYRRYSDAFDRVMDCVRAEYYLEAIAILDSLICDRLSSRLGYVTGRAVTSSSCGQLCGELVGGKSKETGCEKDAAFREAITNIKGWVERRNEAMHATAKVLRRDSSPQDFTAVLQSHRQDAMDGIKHLQAFDELDTASRESAGKYPATYPFAFFPERRRSLNKNTTLPRSWSFR